MVESLTTKTLAKSETISLSEIWLFGNEWGVVQPGVRSRPAEWCHLDRSILNAMTIMP